MSDEEPRRDASRHALRREVSKDTVPLLGWSFIDATMMAWMIDLSGDWSFEVAGSWALCGSGRLAPERLAELLANLDGLVAHVPRVVCSLYPAS